MHTTEYREGIFSFASASHPDRSNKLRKVKRPQDIPIHSHINRGWDHTNLQWEKVLWPKLDCKLQPLQGEATLAERLDWQEADGAEDITMEEAQAEGSSAGMRRIL